MTDFPVNEYGDRAVQLYPPPLNEFQRMQREVHETAIAKGWWDEGRGHGEIIALIHSELSEALEAIRNGEPQSEKIPEFT